MVSSEAIRLFCRSREVDLVLQPAKPPCMLRLHGQFDGYGDFFDILTTDVDYIELADGVTVGDLRLVESVGALAGLSAKWRPLEEFYSGVALAIRSADSGGWASARPEHLFVVIAGQIEFKPGRDWVVTGLKG
jgi:hypothetical protein